MQDEPLFIQIKNLTIFNVLFTLNLLNQTSILSRGVIAGSIKNGSLEPFDKHSVQEIISL